MIKTHGTFEPYTPEGPNGLRHGTLFARNGDGLDWYDLIKTLPAGRSYAVVGGGEVLGMTADPSMLWPVGLEVIETDEPCEVSWRYEEGRLFAPVETLAEAQSRLIAQIDREAETVRQKHITAAPGQAMTYQEKFTQAEAVSTMGEAEANGLTEQQRIAQFPTLAASVGIEAATLWDCATIVIEKYHAWAMLSHHIERARLSAKKEVMNANDPASAEAAYRALAWPT